MLGSGILKGLAVTAKNFVGSFHDPERLPTIEYPEQRASLPENYRAFPFLVFDGEDAIDGLRCVACKMCENECPPQCIYIVIERDEKGKPVKKPKIFDIDLSVCMGCQICVEVCPFDSIKMDKVFELTATDRFNGLLAHREQLARSNQYYHQIRPTEAAEVDARLEEEKRVAAEKAKAAAEAKAAAAAKAGAAEKAVAAEKQAAATPRKPGEGTRPTSDGKAPPPSSDVGGVPPPRKTAAAPTVVATPASPTVAATPATTAVAATPAATGVPATPAPSTPSAAPVAAAPQAPEAAA